MSDEYRRALDAAIREYEQASAEHAALGRRVAQLTQTISTLTRLCGLVPTVPFGLTDACRLVLRNAGTPMTPLAVRERLLSIGFDLDRYANALAAIHTVLKRLADSGEIAPVDDESSRVAYTFVPQETARLVSSPPARERRQSTRHPDAQKRAAPRRRRRS